VTGKVDYLPRALKALEDAPVTVRKAFFKQIGFLEQNLQHPSLRAKKYDETEDLWQARVNRGWRFYFNIVGETYVIRDIIPHPKK
jgi:mRNA-degrading endonuclease RelE of RelBE toxin-antitoxin system